MTRPRRELVSLSDTPYYHCVSRCVRRAFLCGQDHYTGRCYEHRRDWLEQKLLDVASIFAIKLAAYAVMSNHYHVVLHVRTDIANAWSDHEVVERWHSLFSGTALSTQYLAGSSVTEAQEKTLKPLIAEWRSRLTSISWFMRVVNEWIARQANAEDDCTGRFWEGRFKSQALLDDAALLVCMAYVDLNPVRAKIANTPEESDYTSIHQRVWSLGANKPTHPSIEDFVGCKSNETGIPYALRDYLQLIDWTAKIIHPHKRRSLAQNTDPILARINFSSQAWLMMATQFEQQTRLQVNTELIHHRLLRYDELSP